MVEMKSGEVVLSLAAQLASWRAVLVLRTWATCKPWQRKDFHQYSIFLADSLNQSKQTVCKSAGGDAATESSKVGKGRRKRRYADVDGPGAKPEPELGPLGPTLKKQVRKGFDWLDLRLRLQPADSVDITQDFVWERDSTAAQYNDSSSEEFSDGDGLEDVGTLTSQSGRVRTSASEWLSQDLPEAMDPAGSPSPTREEDAPFHYAQFRDAFLDEPVWFRGHSEAMDPAGSPSPTRKVADTARPSSSSPPAASVPGWRSFFCLGNGK